MNTYKRIYYKIRKYDKIVIARHVGPDPDALCSEIALRDSILNTFPHKKVYAIGSNASKFHYLGTLDKIDDDIYSNSLLIVLDVPDKKRVDGVDVDKFEYKIKIDHHPVVDTYCDIEYIDEKASSTCQLILELLFQTRLKLNLEIARTIYLGIVSDTNRFLYFYTSKKTFALIAKMMDKTGLTVDGIYDNLYMRPLKEFKFQGFITNNLTVTENGLAYIKISDETLKEYEVDAATAGNMINNFNYIDEIIVWVFMSEDKNNNYIRTSIRSRGPIINEVASHYNGGGHIYASGCRFSKFSETDGLIKELDELCHKYKSEDINIKLKNS